VDCQWECKGSTQKAGGDVQSERPTCGKEVLVTTYKHVQLTQIMPMLGENVYLYIFLTSPMLKEILAVSLDRVVLLQRIFFQLSGDQGILNPPNTKF
jgi:hypothetical protein